MNILLVFPHCPDTYWSFRHALKFISKKAAVPPLGLLTVAAMLPSSWQKKLVDLNITNLHTKDIQWADYVFISAMYVQKESADKVIKQCLKHNTKIVGGGPLFTQEYESYTQVDHLVLNEAEITLPLFLNDLRLGKPERIYKTEKFADLSLTPAPDYSLLSLKAYASMNIQITRGCPYGCDFCEITSLLGHKVRMKSTEQVTRELNALYRSGWRGAVAIVDDNFIGNRSQLKNSLLPAIKKWMLEHKFPFIFSTQTSINLADDEELMDLMTSAGINSTFIGIETPDAASLTNCKKIQNKNRDLLQSVKKIQNSGIQVSGGFIVGFDSDSPGIFQRQIDFIQQSGIVSAMVGLLNAPKNTKLYKRLETEKRLTVDPTGNNTDFTMNFIPKMNADKLMEGYRTIIQNIYSVKPFYQRIRRSLLNYRCRNTSRKKINFYYLVAFVKSVVVLGIVSKGRTEYWKFIFWTLFHRPGMFADAITYSIYGYHFRIVYRLEK